MGYSKKVLPEAARLSKLYESWDMGRPRIHFRVLAAGFQESSVKICMVAVTGRRSIGGEAGKLLDSYVQRAGKLNATESRCFGKESQLLEYCEAAGRTRPVLVLADSRGGQVSSEEFAAMMGRVRDAGSQLLVLAIGPADGWSAAARGRADSMIAFGRITLPHELAAGRVGGAGVPGADDPGRASLPLGALGAG